MLPFFRVLVTINWCNTCQKFAWLTTDCYFYWKICLFKKCWVRESVSHLTVLFPLSWIWAWMHEVLIAKICLHFLQSVWRINGAWEDCLQLLLGTFKGQTYCVFSWNKSNFSKNNNNNFFKNTDTKNTSCKNRISRKSSNPQKN